MSQNTPTPTRGFSLDVEIMDVFYFMERLIDRRVDDRLVELLCGHRVLLNMQLGGRLMPKIAWMAYISGAQEAGKDVIEIAEADQFVDWARDWIRKHRSSKKAERAHWQTLMHYVSEPYYHSDLNRFLAQYAIMQVNNMFWLGKSEGPTFRIVDAIRETRYGTIATARADDPDGAFIYDRAHIAEGISIEHWSHDYCDPLMPTPRFEMSLEFSEWCIETAKMFQDG